MKNIYIEVTHKCNLQCPHCYNSSGNNKNDMKKELYYKIIQELGENKQETWAIALSGGEPLMHHAICDILRATRSYSNFKVKLITNGVLLENVMEEFLLCDDPISVQISLDGFSEESDGYIRGKNHFQKIVQIVTDLNRAGYRKCILKMTINRINYQELESYVEFALHNNCIPTFSFILKEGNAVANWNELVLPIEKQISVMNELKRILFVNEKKVKEINEQIEIQSLIPRVSYKCPILSKDKSLSVSIKPNGEVQPCQALYNSFFSIGNIANETMSQILNDSENKKIQLIRAFLRNREELLKRNKCNGCILDQKCGTGCITQAISDTNSIMELDNYCGLRRSMYYIKRLSLLKG